LTIDIRSRVIGFAREYKGANARRRLPLKKRYLTYWDYREKNTLFSRSFCGFATLFSRSFCSFATLFSRSFCFFAKIIVSLHYKSIKIQNKQIKFRKL